MKNGRIWTALLLTTVLIGVGGCAGGGGAPASAPATTAGSTAGTPVEPSAPTTSTGPGTESGAATAAAATIKIHNLTFEMPDPVAPGAQVSVTNTDSNEHSVTAYEGAFDVEVKGRGGTAIFTAPAEPGNYPFHCKYHSTMQGTLIVVTD
jgi:plastocyanin